MFKFMKYEIRGTYKFVLATILVVALATIGSQYSVSRMMIQESLLILLFPILIILIIAASIAFIVYIIQSFRKELYEDRGYLTFTLPLGGKKILGAKMLTAIVWYALFGAVVLLVNYGVFNILFGSSFLDQIRYHAGIILNEIGAGYISGILIYILVSSLVTLLTVYFSISLSKVAIKNRSIGGLWILIFIGLQMLFAFIETRVVQLFPAFTSFGGKLTSVENLLITEYGVTVDIMADSPVISISGLIYWILLGIGLFIGTGYLLDNKLDL